MVSPTDIRLPQRHVEHCMGTVFSIDVRAPGVDRAAIDAVVRYLHWVDETFSPYKPSSQISRLSRGYLSIDDCALEVSEVLARCDELSMETSGYFSAYANGTLDPSGLVKGWAIQRASELLTATGSTNHCVNGGGDVQCAGSAEPGRPWRIGITHPLRPVEITAVVAGHDLAVATSGTAERGTHIVSPGGDEAMGCLASVTIVGTHLATVDAYATAAFAMGVAARTWIETCAGFYGLIVYTDGTQWSSPGLAADTAHKHSLGGPGEIAP
jgi:thiamine biosynthesis lipoprotein